jgi:hypothetical protein
MGSSPVPGIHDSNRQNPSKTGIAKGLGQSGKPSQVRQQAAVSAPIRPLTATENATSVLPADTGLATVIDDWDRLPEAVRAGIVAMVKAAAKGSGR